MSVAASRGRSGPLPSAKSFDSALSTSLRVIPSMPTSPPEKLQLGMRLQDIILATEAVHVKRPLQADDGALDGPEKSKRQNNRQRHPDDHMHPHRQFGHHLDRQET